MEEVAYVRNATLAAKELASSTTGQLARIEVLVTVSCLLVGVLVLSNSRRRHERHALARLLVWAAFMLNYPVISYTIGLMQSSSIRNELFVVWACFLLLLLGSADAMTALSFHDGGSQQKRSMANQALHVVYLLFLMLYYKGHLRGNFRVSLFLLWGLSVVRLGLRAKAYRSTCRSRGLLRENQAVFEYMKNEPRNSAGAGAGDDGRRFGAGYSSYDAETMDGYIYLVDGVEAEEVKNGEEIVHVACGAPETVDVSRIWRCRGKLLQPDGGDHGASRRRDLCLSFALFRLLRLRFAADHVGSTANLPFQRDKSRHFVVNGLLSEDEDLDRAFRVVETELGFLFDFFYARHPSLKHTMAPDLIVQAVILAASMFTLFCPDLLKYRPDEGSENIFIHGFNLDLVLTRLVIVWFVFLESYQFLALVFSDWHKVKMLCQYVRRNSWHGRAFVEIPLKILCHFTFTKYWKGSIGQYFVLDDAHPRRRRLKSFLSWVSLGALDTSLRTCSVALPSEVRRAVLRRLKDTKGEVTDGRMWLYDMGAVDLHLDRDCMLGHTYARYILTWHIATSICCYGGLPLSPAASTENTGAELAKNHAVATKLSGYCAYLLAFRPELVPDSTCTSSSLARGTLRNAREYLAGCKSDEERYEKLMQLGSSDRTKKEVRFLSEGARIAVYLVGRVADVEELWRVLAVFWANMVLYIAPSDRAVAHATAMAAGGEFITLVWALLTHGHVVDKLQETGGAPGLHMVRAPISIE